MLRQENKKIEKNYYMDRVCIHCNQVYGSHSGTSCPDKFLVHGKYFEWDGISEYEDEIKPEPHVYSPVNMTGRYRTIGD